MKILACYPPKKNLKMINLFGRWPKLYFLFLDGHLWFFIHILVNYLKKKMTKIILFVFGWSSLVFYSYFSKLLKKKIWTRFETEVPDWRNNEVRNTPFMAPVAEGTRYNRWLILCQSSTLIPSNFHICYRRRIFTKLDAENALSQIVSGTYRYWLAVG